MLRTRSSLALLAVAPILPVAFLIVAAALVAVPAISVAQAQDDCTYSGSDLDFDGIDDGLEQCLIDRHAPYLYFDSHEDNWPSSVVWYAHFSELRYHDLCAACVFATCLDENKLVLPEYSDPNSLIDPPSYDRDPLPGCNTPALHSESANAQDYMLGGGEDDPLTSQWRMDLDNGWESGVSPPYPVGQRHVGLYGHVFRPDSGTDPLSGCCLPGTICVQYLQFFPFNDADFACGGLCIDGGDHEGDWAYLEVYVTDSPPYNVQRVVWHHHGDSHCAPTIYDGDLLPSGMHEGTAHPNCYLETGTHEFWPTSSTSGNIGCWFFSDTFNGQSPNSYQSDNVPNIGEIWAPMPGPSGSIENRLVLLYNGKWGKFAGPMANSPFGPIYNTVFRHSHGPIPTPRAPASACTQFAPSLYFSWGAAPFAKSYHLQVATSATFDDPLLYDGPSLDGHLTSVEVGGFQPKTDYYWRVAAISIRSDGGGWNTDSDDWSKVVSFRTGPLTPPAPTLSSPASGATGNPTEGTLDWTDVSDVVYYNVVVRCVATGEVVLSRTVVESNCLYSLPDATYEWFVVARRECGVASPATPTWIFTVGNGSSCPIPTLSEPANGSVCQPDSGMLRWAPIPGATGYIVGISDHCDNKDTFHVSVPELDYGRLLQPKLSAGRTYYWSVKVDCGCAPYSDCFSFRVEDNWNKVPGLVSPADGASNVYTIGTLGWNTISEADSYRVQLGAVCGTGPEYDVTAGDFAYSGLQPNTTYFWRVRAHEMQSSSRCPRWGTYSECDSLRTGNGTNRVYVASDLSFERGQTAVMIPIRGENTAELKRFDVEVNWDRDVFDYAGWVIAGTKAEGAAKIDSSGDTSTLRLNVRYTMDQCPPSITVGDGVLFYLILNVKGNAPLGATPISFSVSSFVGCTGGLSPLAFDGIATITGSGTDQYYFPAGLSVGVGQPVVIPVRAENLQQLREYGFRVTWDKSVFDYLGTSLAGTRGENPAHVDSTHGADNLRLRVQQPCPPGIPAGDGDVAHILLLAKTGAPIGPTTLVFDGTADNYYIDCAGRKTSPMLLPGEVEIQDVTTAIALVTLNAEANAGWVRIRWYAPGDEIISTDVYRRAIDNDWALVGHPIPDLNHQINYEDDTVAPETQYGYRLVVRDITASTDTIETWVTTPGRSAPSVVRLQPAQPNPFGSQGSFSYGIPRSGSVRLTVYDLQGRRVATVVDRVEPAGWRSVIWDGRDGAGHPVVSGMYFARLEAGGVVRTQKLVIAR